MIVKLAKAAMGTRFEIVLMGQDETQLRAAGEEAIFEIEECDRRLSYHSKESLLSHINRHAAAAAMPVDEDTFALLRLCAELHKETGGAFDPSYGSPQPGLGQMQLAACEGQSCVRFAALGLSLDLGGIAKGHSLDLAARALREAGVTCAFLHGGTSSAIAIGSPPGKAGFEVQLSEAGSLRSVLLCDKALSVSCATSHRVGEGSEAHWHIRDPLRGASIAGSECVAECVAERAIERASEHLSETATERVVVIGRSAAAVDGWSTALAATSKWPGRQLSLPKGIVAHKWIVGLEAEAAVAPQTCQETE